MGRPQVFDEDEVISKALEIFWKQGFQGTTTKDLIEGTSISNGSFFNSFTGKKKMYLKCLEKYFEIYMARLDNLLLSDEPFRNKIDKVLHYTVRKDPKGGAYVGCFHFNTLIDDSINDEEISKLAEEINARVERSFKIAASIAQKKKEISQTIDSTAIANYLTAIISGLRVMMKSNPPQSILINVINTTIDSLS